MHGRTGWTDWMDESRYGGVVGWLGTYSQNMYSYKEKQFKHVTITRKTVCATAWPGPAAVTVTLGILRPIGWPGPLNSAGLRPGHVQGCLLMYKALPLYIQGLASYVPCVLILPSMSFFIIWSSKLAKNPNQRLV